MFMGMVYSCPSGNISAEMQLCSPVGLYMISAWALRYFIPIGGNAKASMRGMGNGMTHAFLCLLI